MTTIIHAGTELLQMSCSAKQDMRSKLVMWLLQRIVFSKRQNSSSIYFASWGKIDTAQKYMLCNTKIDIMKESKKEFKYALRACRKSQQKCKADAMAEASWNRYPKKFWQNIRKSKKSWLHLQWEVKQEIKQSLSCGENTFQHCWTPKNCEIGNFVQQNITSHGNFEGIDELMCNSFKIKSLLHKLPLNRAVGKDGIFAEHIFYADSSAFNHLSSLFNACLMHRKIPQECMQTIIVSICKNKNGNISDAGNYRPVSLATIISKLFEHYILSCIFPLLATTDNQFGLKPKHGTDMCIFFLKQTVSYYVSKHTPVFSAFLDASKAFDRTNHNLLFAKLIKHNVPMSIARLLLSWYRQQTMQVNTGSNCSSPLL